jgi:hypothetical protein
MNIDFGIAGLVLVVSGMTYAFGRRPRSLEVTELILSRHGQKGATNVWEGCGSD